MGLQATCVTLVRIVAHEVQKSHEPQANNAPAVTAGSRTAGWMDRKSAVDVLASDRFPRAEPDKIGQFDVPAACILLPLALPRASRGQMETSLARHLARTSRSNRRRAGGSRASPVSPSRPRELGYGRVRRGAECCSGVL